MCLLMEGLLGVNLRVLSRPALHEKHVDRTFVVIWPNTVLIHQKCTVATGSRNLLAWTDYYMCDFPCFAKTYIDAWGGNTRFNIGNKANVEGPIHWTVLQDQPFL